MRVTSVDELVAWLRENPIVGAAAMARAKVAGPWSEGDTDQWTRDGWAHDGTAATVTPKIGRLGAPEDWHWVGPLGDGVEATEEEAKAKADASLVAAGWVLA